MGRPYNEFVTWYLDQIVGFRATPSTQPTNLSGDMNGAIIGRNQCLMTEKLHNGKLYHDC